MLPNELFEAVHTNGSCLLGVTQPLPLAARRASNQVQLIRLGSQASTAVQMGH